MSRGVTNTRVGDRAVPRRHSRVRELFERADDDDDAAGTVDAEGERELDVGGAARAGDERAAGRRRDGAAALAEILLGAEPQIGAAHDRQVNRRQQRRGTWT